MMSDVEQKFLEDKRFLEGQLRELKQIKFRSGFLSLPDQKRFVQCISLLKELKRNNPRIAKRCQKTSAAIRLPKGGVVRCSA
jgi:hypothetical protein